RVDAVRSDAGHRRAVFEEGDGLRGIERTDLDEALPLDPERFSGGHEEGRSPFAPAPQQRGRDLEDLLDVVEDHHAIRRRLDGAADPSRPFGGLRAVERDIEGGRDGSDGGALRGGARQVAKDARPSRGELERATRLARTTGTDEGHEPSARG